MKLSVLMILLVAAVVLATICDADTYLRPEPLDPDRRLPCYYLPPYNDKGWLPCYQYRPPYYQRKPLPPRDGDEPPYQQVSVDDLPYSNHGYERKPGHATPEPKPTPYEKPADHKTPSDSHHG